MGHATVTNICVRFIKGMVAKGSISMKECADDLEKRGETLNASEGKYTERYMLLMGLEQIVDWYRRYAHREPVIVPHEITKEQEEMLDQWDNNTGPDGDWSDSWNEERQAVLDSIRWKFAPSWRHQYQYHKDKFPILDYVSN